MAIGLVLGGGAPNLPLMTGALLALDKAGVDFNVITTTGAGMVVGLLYAAPRENDTDNTWVKARRAALQATREWGIDDLIYEMVPINYKIFQKPGTLARAFSHATNPFLWSIPRETRRQRLLGDSLALMASAMSPSDLGAKSKGLCQSPPWIELLVDFDKLTENLADGDVKFRLSAYCIDDEDEKTFHKEDITAEHFKAALAMPFIYAPYKLKDKDGTWKTYLEGSAFKTLALDPEHVMSEGNDIDTVIFFDIMGNRNLIGEPRWLIDAWGKSIIAPLTRLAELGLDEFKMKRDKHLLEFKVRELLDDLKSGDKKKVAAKAAELEETLERLRRLEALRQDRSPEGFEKMRRLQMATIGDTRSAEQGHEGDAHAHDHRHDRVELIRMPFRKHIPEERWPEVLDWSYTNMSKLFDIGVETGEQFVSDHQARLERSLGRKIKLPEGPGYGETERSLVFLHRGYDSLS